MKCLITIPTLAFFLLSLVAVMPLSAQQKAMQGQEAQSEWSVHVYRYPSTELIGGFVSSEHGQLTPPPLPATDASEETIATFLRRSHFIMDQHLRIQGITLPSGSLAIFDPKNKTLALRSTKLAHERVTALATQYENISSRLVSFSVQIIETDSNTVREAVKKAVPQSDHSAALAMLDALVTQNKARYIDNLRLETKSGMRTAVTRGEGRLYISEMTLDESKRSSTALEERRAGTIFEVEPIIGADGSTLELSVSLEHHHGLPLEHWDKINFAGDRSVESPNIDFHLAHVTTGLTMLSGMTKLLGIWQPEGIKEAERAKNLQAAFLKANIVTLLPALDARVEQLLKQHGEKVEKTPTTPPPEPPGATKGIITRSFHITEDLLTSGGASSASAADPFAAGGAAPAAAPMANEARLTMRITAVEILKSQGIPFPEGSSANFNPSTGELLVRNTPQNMMLVEGYLASLKRRAPHNLVMTLHVIEADAATIRQLDQDTASTTDHTAAWQTVEQSVTQNKVRILRSALIETKSGVRCTFSTGREFIYPTGTLTDTQVQKSDSATTANGNDKDAKTTTINNIKISNGTAPRFSSDLEMRPVGLRFETEPSTQSDASTVEVTYSLEYDYAAPVVNDSMPQGDAKTIRPLNRSIQFHQAKLTTGTTMATGASRLLGIWKPEGTPEFDKADVLQAAFLSMNVVPVEQAKKP